MHCGFSSENERSTGHAHDWWEEQGRTGGRNRAAQSRVLRDWGKDKGTAKGHPGQSVVFEKASHLRGLN